MSAQLLQMTAENAGERERACRARLERDPLDLDALEWLGELLQAQHRYEEALDCFRRALEQSPTEPRLYNRFGNALQALGDLAGAVEVYVMALALGPDAAVHNNLAVALKKLGRLEEAQNQLQRALELEPEFVDALTNMGNVLKLAGEPAAAIDFYRRALEQEPRRAATYSNLGNAFQALGRFDDAAELYELALGFEPTLVEARWNRALLHLQRGDFACGWAEYEWGIAAGDRPARSFDRPRWEGEPLQGRRILVFTEQGFGDTIQFVRRLPAVRDRGGYVVLECPRPLLDLMKTSGLADEVVERTEAGVPDTEFDLQISLMSLPAVLGLNPEEAPAAVPYLQTDPIRCSRWQERIPAGNTLRVGIVWSGNVEQRINRVRACTLADFAPVAQLAGVSLYSLQKGEPAQQAQSPLPGMAITCLSDQLTDFAETAAAIEQLDLVITVDTAVAHLAGALGKPVWTLLAFVSDWRWLLEREDSPWYPSMRLFRQFRAGDWPELMARVAAELASLSASRAAEAGAAAAVSTPSAAAVSGDTACLLQQGMALHQAGDVQGAAHLYQQVLAAHPDNADALRLLGVIAQHEGDLDRAAELMGRALAAEPQSALIYTSLGNVYKDQNAPGLALQCYRAALDLDPGFADAWLGAGIAQQLSGDFEAAIQTYGHLLALVPEHARAHFNLALALRAVGRDSDAAEWLQRLIQIDPRSVEARVQLGQLLLEADELESAAAQFESALTVDEHCFEAHRLLGDIHKDQGRFREAVDAYRRALALQPDAMGVHNNLGNTYRAMGCTEEAERCYLKTVELRPHAPEGYNNLGTLYKDSGQLSKAQDWFEKTLEVAPEFTFALGNLAKVYQESCSWERHQTTLQRLIAATEELLEQGKRVPMPPFFSLSLPVGADFQQWVARNYTQTVVLHGLVNPGLSPNPKPDERGRLRIGYVSSDFHNHATAQLMLSLFGLHDRDAFEIYAYSLGKDDGSHYRHRIAADCDHFREVRDLHYTDIARRIVDDGIHILVDLKGYTMDIRPEIFALRPAPIQVSYLGFPGTMGAPFMDYIVTDATVTPPEQQQYYDERFVYLPHSYQVNDHQQPIAETTPTRGECGLPETGFVFCCFNNNYKVEPDVFGIWMRILQQVPGSVLWLLRASPESEANLRRGAAARSVAPERLIFAERRPKAEHLARHRLADLFLDTLYYNAHTTASDALWAGLPLLTCPGQTFASRVGASLLRAVGLPELIADSREAYERRAVQLARDPHALAELRARLQQGLAAKPLFDTPRFARNLERAYRAMWSRHERGEDPGVITITEAKESSMQGAAAALHKDTYNELLIGCGSRHEKDIHVNQRKHWSNLVTLDINADHGPDVVWDLTRLPLPFEDNSFDEIHAYEVLEHVGSQGDYRFFFAQFSEFWRILKPGGALIGTVPLTTSVWAWGDPSHTRVIPKESFIFLDQTQYTAQVGKTPMSDFRYLYKADFHRLHVSEAGEKLAFVLQAVKPSRISI